MSSFKLAFLRIARRKSQLNSAIGIVIVIQFSVGILGLVVPKVEAQSLTQVVNNLAEDQRWFTANLPDATKLNSPEINNVINAEFKKLAKTDNRHSVTYRPIFDDFAGRYQLIGTDQIELDSTLIEGKFPKSCTSVLCEVIVINADQLTKIPAGLKIVGTGRLSEDTPLISTIEQGTALLVANSASSVTQLPQVKGYPASELWSIEIDPNEIQKYGLSNYLSLIEEVNSNLSQVSGNLLISGPLGLLKVTESQVSVLINRIISLIFAITLIVLMALFFISKSTKLINDQYFKSAQRLTLEKKSQIVFQLSLAFFVSLVGTLTGILISVLLGLALGSGINLKTINIELVLFNFISIGLVIFIALLSDKKQQALGFLVLFFSFILLFKTSDLDYKFSLVPLSTLVIVFAVYLTCRKLLSENLTKNTFLSNQNYFLAIGVVTALLISTVVSAFAYLSALNLNVNDNAVFNSPTQSRITSGGEARPMQFNSFADYQSISGGSEVFGVIKVATQLPDNLITSIPTQLVGVDPSVWNFVPNIKHQTGMSLLDSAKLLPSEEVELGIPATGSKIISLQVDGLDPNTLLGAWILNDRNESFLLELEKTVELYQAQLPANTKNLIGFQITEVADYKARREHAVGEGKNSLPAPQGNISFTAIKLDNASISDLEINNVAYSLLNGPVYISHVEKPDRIPALVDPSTARLVKKSEFNLRVSKDVFVELNTVGIVNQLPTVPMQFALVNPDLLTQFLAATTPELLRTSEVWITKDLTLNKITQEKLAGLTIFNQQDLIFKNQSPANADWSKYSLYFLVILAVVLFLLIASDLSREIFKDHQFFGWLASGLSANKIRRITSSNFIFFNFVIGFFSLIYSAFAIRQYIHQSPFDINGNLAYPPLVVIFEYKNVLGIFISFVVLLLVTVLLVSRRLMTGGEKNEN